MAVASRAFSRDTLPKPFAIFLFFHSFQTTPPHVCGGVVFARHRCWNHAPKDGASLRQGDFYAARRLGILQNPARFHPKQAVSHTLGLGGLMGDQQYCYRTLQDGQKLLDPQG